MTNAREKAIERLAAILAGRMENTSTVTGAEEDGVAMLSALALHRPHIAEKIRNHAAVIFDALGLVAIDPALVERYAKANEGWEQPWPEGAGPGGPHAESVHAALAAAAIPLADAVLAQLRAKP
jgi:hypothetical protein